MRAPRGGRPCAARCSAARRRVTTCVLSPRRLPPEAPLSPHLDVRGREGSKARGSGSQDTTQTAASGPVGRRGGPGAHGTPGTLRGPRRGPAAGVGRLGPRPRQRPASAACGQAEAAPGRRRLGELGDPAAPLPRPQTARPPRPGPRRPGPPSRSSGRRESEGAPYRPCAAARRPAPVPSGPARPPAPPALGRVTERATQTRPSPLTSSVSQR